MQGGARGCKGVQGVTSGAKPAAAKPTVAKPAAAKPAVAKPAAVKLAAAKPAVAKPAAFKADYSRPMQTKTDQSEHGRLWHSDICGATSISDAFFWQDGNNRRRQKIFCRGIFYPYFLVSQVAKGSSILCKL